MRGSSSGDLSRTIGRRTENSTIMTIEQAIRELLEDPAASVRLHDAYIGLDPLQCARRFEASGEFAEVLRQLGQRHHGTILDLGAGNGIASYAFASNGAACVFAIEPDNSALVGRQAIAHSTRGLPVQVLGGVGEQIPLPNEAVDVVFARQVLHHTRDPNQVLRECWRVCRRGGVFVACREHVVDNPKQLRTFLARHPIHQKVSGENAFPLATYLRAIADVGFQLQVTWGPWDSVINAAPGVTTQAVLPDYPSHLLGARLGSTGETLGAIMPIRWLIWQWLKRPVAGRLYSFLAVKP